ncbi:MAG: gamma-glutamylcyclotransferase [Gammaproteobacteria bacterium]|nr:gamma-glutamylcyclotransferase [Gammaproteobacteria bacterium]
MELDDQRLYFAYGMNTNLEGMKVRCPQAEPIGQAVLQDYRLVFRGVADIEPADGDEVAGVLWWITPDCEDALDILEGYPYMYGKRVVSVTRPEGNVMDAMVYYMMDQDAEASPSHFYMDELISGYRTFKLDLNQLTDAVKSCSETLTEKEIKNQYGL